MADLFATGTAGLLASWELNRLAAALQGTFGWSVQSGAVTFSATLTFNVAAVAAGDCTVNSVTNTAYAGGTVTLGAQDATNPRVDIIVITAAGAVSVVAGTPAALTTTAGPVPTAPSSSQLEIARIFVPATGTPLSASSITDKRATLATVSPITLAGSSSAATSTTSTSAVDLVTISGLSIPVTSGFTVSWNGRKQALAANSVNFGVKVNATTIHDCAVTEVAAWLSSANNRAEDGSFEFRVWPRSSANYLNGFSTFGQWRVSATAAQATASAVGNATADAVMPNATVTSVAVRAINNTASNAVEVTSIRILTGVQ